MDTLLRIVALSRALREGDRAAVNRLLDELEARMRPEDYFELLVELFSKPEPPPPVLVFVRCA